jgi:phosphonate utilization transcriptional regulator
MPSPPAARATIDLLQRESLTTVVRHEVERMIVGGEVGAGDKLSEEAVAGRLGVSRGPVREAFRALAESGLVQFEKNRGVFVRRVSIEEADEIYDIRAALDQHVGRRLAESITTEQLKALRTLVERMERAVAQEDVKTYSDLNLRFHDTLLAFTGNAKLIETYRRLVNELNLYRRDALLHDKALLVSVAEHKAIVKAIAGRDPEAAGRVLYDHVMASRERMHRAIGAPPSTRKPAGTPRKNP